MKKPMKRVISMLLIAVMVMAMIGCKKKEKESDRIVTPEPTPTPAVTMEDLYEAQKKNTAKYTELIKTAYKDQKLTLPDINSVIDVDLKGSFNLMDAYKVNLNFDTNADITASDNISHIILDMLVDIAINDAPIEEEDKTAKGEIYIDNTSEEVIRIYEKEEGKEWKLHEQSFSELVGQINQNVADAQTETPEEQKYFKDLDDFLKAHTVMEGEFGTFRNTTSFTLQEFHEYYKADFDAILADLSNSLTNGTGTLGSLAGDNSMGIDLSSMYGMIIGVVGECFNSMSGDIKTVQEFDLDLEPTLMTMTVSNLSMGSQGDLKVSLNIENFSLKIENRKDKVKVTIPQDVINSAVPESDEVTGI